MTLNKYNQTTAG